MVHVSGRDGRLTALGNQLIDIHIRLREELARLRAGVHDDPAAFAGDLRTHCLAFCSAVTKHHTNEDDRAFPALAAKFPELRPVLDELREDHGQIAGLLRRVADLASGGQLGPAAGTMCMSQVEHRRHPDLPHLRRGADATAHQQRRRTVGAGAYHHRRGLHDLVSVARENLHPASAAGRATVGR